MDNELRFVIFGSRIVMAYNNDITLKYNRNEDKWYISDLDYQLIEIMDGKEYTELEEKDIIELYGIEIVNKAKELLIAEGN